jgi:hypothetical protein
MYSELEGRLEDMFVAYFRVLFWHMSLRVDRNHKITGAPAKIQTRNLLNTMQEW